MTCIVGIAHANHVYIGGDSAGVDSRYHLVARQDHKVFRTGEFVMGFTSSFRMGQLLAFDFHPPMPRSGTDLMAYMVTDFIDAARRRMREGGYMTVKDSVETGGEFLVGFKGRLFHIDSDFQVGESQHGYDACGCGDLIALGSLHATRATDMPPQDRIRAALEAAETFSAAVRAPFIFFNTAS